MEAVAKIDMSLGKIVFWFILYSVYLRFTRIPMDSETSKSFSYFEDYILVYKYIQVVPCY